jgi:DNA modification methylase
MSIGHESRWGGVSAQEPADLIERSSQLPLPFLAEWPQRDRGRASATSTFVPNMRLPVHGWFRFSAGFSAAWARGLIGEVRRTKREVVLLDPFAGVGTSVLAGEEAGVTALGLEAQPFTARIAQAKLLWHTPVDEFTRVALAVLHRAQGENRPLTTYPQLIEKCFPAPVLQELHNLRMALQDVADGYPASELTRLALCAILRVCSPVGTASWQYVLPNKAKARTIPPYDAFALQIDKMAADMRARQAGGTAASGSVLLADARACAGIEDDSINLVVTSPPYTNNYDYADATRLEMSFFGEVQGWGDLKQARKDLVRSCSQHVSIERVDLDATLAQLSDTPIHAELGRVCAQLGDERLQHGGKKDYHLMVAAYFADMKQVWRALRRVCRPGADVCFVVGDSAPYGIHVPVDRWLGELAVAAGFHNLRFEKVRDRNVKWKNRKHRVPLHEGRLWVEG